MARAFVVALLGAESTGKTTLAGGLAAALAADGHRVAQVPEYLREFCDSHARTPRVDEQRGIADEQTRRIALAAERHDVVVADTTALMIAVYSDTVFGDTGLYAAAGAAHARCDLTLLTALDIPWRADGLQRDGPQVREPVDARVRRALQAAGVPYAVVAGQGERRLAHALQATRHAMARAGGAAPVADPYADMGGRSTGPRWHWVCEHCGDAECERHALRGG